MTTKNPFASCFPGFFTFVQNDKKILFSLFKGRYGEAERDLLHVNLSFRGGMK